MSMPGFEAGASLYRGSTSYSGGLRASGLARLHPLLPSRPLAAQPYVRIGTHAKRSAAIGRQD
jgi:hypothetical protein